MTLTTTARTNVAEIAARLTFVEQCFLHEWRIRMAYPFEVKARDRLVQRGLVRKRWFGYRFTPLGLALRIHLASEEERLKQEAKP